MAEGSRLIVPFAAPSSCHLTTYRLMSAGLMVIAFRGPKKGRMRIPLDAVRPFRSKLPFYFGSKAHPLPPGQSFIFFHLLFAGSK
jgi:hypothetical protein